MVRARFRFYEELNDFLAPERRRREFECVCARAATVKHMIEALGVPHTEVERILVNGESCGFGRVLRDGDRVAVYPRVEAPDVTPQLRVRDGPPREMRFIADAHLGALARFLRMSGFDTLFDPALQDADIERIAVRDGRIVLTRDRELLKRRGIQRGCYLHARRPEQQLREVFARLDLMRSLRPFTLCMCCNAPLRSVEPAAVLDRLPPSVRELHTRFTVCDACGRVFWQGSHWLRMRRLLAEVTPAAVAAAGPAAAAPGSTAAG